MLLYECAAAECWGRSVTILQPRSGRRTLQNQAVVLRIDTVWSQFRDVPAVYSSINKFMCRVRLSRPMRANNYRVIFNHTKREMGAISRFIWQEWEDQVKSLPSPQCANKLSHLGQSRKNRLVFPAQLVEPASLRVESPDTLYPS